MDDIDVLISTAVGADRDPYPEFARKRREDPVSHEVGFGGKNLVFTAYRYDDVEYVLKHPELFDSRVYAPAIGMVFGPSIIQMDGAEHHSHRGLIGGAFRRTVINDWELSLIAPTVNALVDEFAARGRAELVRDFTIRFPIRIIARILGIPEVDYDEFARLSIRLISIAQNIQVGLDAAAALKDFFGAIIAERRAEPKDDMISTLVHARIDGEPLPDEEILGFLRLLLPAGAETTYRLLGNLLFALLSDPSQWEAVRDDRSLLPAAIEEALRWEAPVAYVSREALADTTIGGTAVPKGAHVSLSIGSANHDDAVYDDAERYDVARAPARPHLSFAEGPHRCLGEHLARVETVVAMNALLDRFPRMRLDPGDADPHVQGHAFRSPTSIPVAL